ncbi:hypothetical protein SAMD00019534_104630 [Acytostelium subglobosum LB1]|uniref:hypothetical protein n=1 Tax=Acytostelium subglobosum LB1 TaxID=1410327 RepID=UPI000644E52B|nr:hypothetical protein SAMD00019534_104630 [Acytostelium subglobosum LB1]GAM27288.1 hypothetical protein SAMD00019534_104630 [Acytostelium subglobosum LB1]|eukprot:XP_012749755.1 hypothetical protein SAMD00019534_104630 [Acytostelium subglobosum LB1]
MSRVFYLSLLLLVISNYNTSASCIANAVCANKDEQCGSNNGTIVTCNYGYYCNPESNTCEDAIQDGDKCVTSASCLNSYCTCLEDDSGETRCTPINYVGLNEPCNSTIQCTTPLMCKGHYCTVEGACTDLPKANENCTIDVGCGNGLTCGKKGMSMHYGECIEAHSKSQGSPCYTDSECDIEDRLYCLSQYCTYAEPSKTTNCTVDGCDDLVEQCSCDSGACYTKVAFNRECKILSDQMSQCAWSSKCPRVSNTRYKACINMQCGLYKSCYIEKCMPTIANTTCTNSIYDGSCDRLDKLLEGQNPSRKNKNSSSRLMMSSGGVVIALLLLLL